MRPRNIDVAARPVVQIATAGELDIHPPLYFYVLHVWLGLSGHATAPSGQDAGQDAGPLAFAVRFLSLWFGVLFVALIVHVGASHRHVWRRHTWRRPLLDWPGRGRRRGVSAVPAGRGAEARMYTMALVWLAATGLALLKAGSRGFGGRVRGQRTGDGDRRQGTGIGWRLPFFGPCAADALRGQSLHS